MLRNLAPFGAERVVIALFLQNTGQGFALRFLVLSRRDGRPDSSLQGDTRESLVRAGVVAPVQKESRPCVQPI